ncbi:pilus assembly protein [Stigmatella sp. ncwal1]|uniref:Pilus assembly protein n=1 Tax=Stigmatella ashevillensis TaxID=2995309 RepID=A0ABT5DGS9_9BACT|nr:TadE family protein [Stigmatella ashevillena]MDC0712872.1 pilus assembly protein [Stigmatella ashevillena]
MSALRQHPRGQSVVELAVGLIVFITVMMFGIHFAEVGYLSLKVHEAAVSPLWDSTAFRVHRMQHQPDNIGDFSTFPSIAPWVMSDANLRYRDFDGRSSTSGDRDQVSHVFTRIDGMQVQCERDDKVEFDLPRSRMPAMRSPRAGDWGYYPPGQDVGAETDSVLDEIYENVGGISCTAEAHVEGLSTLPTSFLEGTKGFFQAPHSVRLDMKTCAAGRAVGGVCQGRYGILLGDFGFSDADLSGHCPLQPEMPDSPCAENRAFYYAARKVFDQGGRAAGNAASEFAEFFVGYSPIDENSFFMSYRGEEDGYIERDTPRGESQDERDRPRNTGGIDHKPEAIRRNSNKCFLGLTRC